MKSFALFFFIFCISVMPAISQKSIHFSAKDGTTADVEVINNNPDEGRNSSIYLGFIFSEGVNNIGFSTYKPEKYYLNIMGGFTGGMLDGSIIFNNKLKNTTISQSLKGRGNVVYVGKIPIEKRVSYGLHGGFGYTDYSFGGTSNDNAISTMSAFAGLSLLTAKHLNIVIDEDIRRGARNGTALFRLNADAVFYFNQKFIRGQFLNPGFPQNLEEGARQFGFRVYMDGKSTLWGRKGRGSINYMLGAGQNSDRGQTISVIAGFGFGYNF